MTSSAAGFFARVKDQIAGGDERGALEVLRQLLKERVPTLYNETILQMSRVNQRDQSERLGEATREDIRVETVRLRKALLSLVDAAEAALSSSSLPAGAEPVVFSKTPENTGLEKILGANNLKSIAWLRRGLDVARSVCRVVTPQWVGSGFLLAGGRLLTNHHIIPSAAVAASSYVEFNVEEDFAGNLLPASRVFIDATSVAGDALLDYCTATLKEAEGAPPLETWGSLEVDAQWVPAIGEHVTIIQHPAGGPKQVAITANQVVNVYEHRLQYSTDTMPGSSGSPVFNDAWKVVALHHKGGNIVANASGARMFANEGILMKYLTDRMDL
jgi:V8-like Glu-specific endopeptidase